MNKRRVRTMKQYKTIAGPIGLEALTGEGYEYAVKQYARIIDNEAVGGWALHLIQQISVKKLVFTTLIIGAALGAVFAMIYIGMNDGRIRIGDTRIEYIGGFIIGLFLGGGLGCLGLKYEEVLFNMLVFVKDDGSTGSGTFPIVDSWERSSIASSQQSVSTPTNQSVVSKVSELSGSENSNDKWICKKCEVLNKGNAIYCIHCGNHK